MLNKLTLLAATFVTTQSFALDIVITNDDSFITHNIQQLKVALENAGHDVTLSVPCAKQSGKGGSMGSYLKPMPVSTLDTDATGGLTINADGAGTAGYCVGNTEAEKETLTFKDYMDGTPLQAVLHGLSKAHTKWGKKPDLVISGPNEGNNMGFANNISGTLGATHASIVQGVPAIAISDHEHHSTYDRATAVASIVVGIVSQLESTRKNGEKMLPAFTALNVNTPEVLEGAEYKFTQVGWASGINLKFGDLGIPNSYGASLGYTEGQATGLNFILGDDMSGDTNSDSEGNAKEEGFITISTIDAQEQANKAKTAHTENALHDLVK